jgi:16S rRNA processing protein RimM
VSERSASTAADESRVIVGQLVGVYGVRGWLRLKSFTDPIENIVEYAPWQVRFRGQWRDVDVVAARAHGKGLVVQLDGVDDRDAAAAWVGSDVAVARDALPRLSNDEYYWSDLIGLEVVTTGGATLGHVDSLLETGANDVLVVRGDRERLIPFLPDRVVRKVDLDARRIEVEWDPDF